MFCLKRQKINKKEAGVGLQNEPKCSPISLLALKIIYIIVQPGCKVENPNNQGDQKT